LLLGELIGGLDIVREMAVESELKDVIPQLEKEEDINDRIKVSYILLQFCSFICQVASARRQRSDLFGRRVIVNAHSVF